MSVHKFFRVYLTANPHKDHLADFVRVSAGRLFLFEGEPGGKSNQVAEYNAGAWTGFQEVRRDGPQLQCGNCLHIYPDSPPGNNPPCPHCGCTPNISPNWNPSLPIISPNWDSPAPDIVASIKKVNDAFEKMTGWRHPVDIQIRIGGKQVSASKAMQAMIDAQQRLKRDPTWAEFIEELNKEGIPAEIACEVAQRTMKYYRRMPTREEYEKAVADQKPKTDKKSDCFEDLRPSPEMQRHLRAHPAVMTADQEKANAGRLGVVPAWKTAAGKIIFEPRKCCAIHLQMDCDAMGKPIPKPAPVGLLNACDSWREGEKPAFLWGHVFPTQRDMILEGRLDYAPFAAEHFAAVGQFVYNPAATNSAVKEKFAQADASTLRDVRDVAGRRGWGGNEPVEIWLARKLDALADAIKGRDEVLNMIEATNKKFDAARMGQKDNDRSISAYLGQLIRQIPPVYLSAGNTPEEIVGLSVSRLVKIAETVQEYSLIAGRLGAIEDCIKCLAERRRPKPAKNRPAKIKAKRRGAK